MKVWIDQDLCTGDGLCEEIAPDVFTLLHDGLAYVQEGSKVFSDPGRVEGLDLNVPEGGVYGFLGPNGSGKTTTIRCLLGLVAATAGTSRVLGASVPSRLPAVIDKVGSLVETPALFPTFSGRRNLLLLG